MFLVPLPRIEDQQREYLDITGSDRVVLLRGAMSFRSRVGA